MARHFLSDDRRANRGAPIAVQGLELVVHALNGTPHVSRGFWISCAITALASFFTWYITHRGTLITEAEGQSLKQDIARLPRLILDFILAGPQAIWRLFRPAKPTMMR
jgi:hypothetical protein